MIVTTTMSSTSVKPPVYFRRVALMERAGEKKFLIENVFVNRTFALTILIKYQAHIFDVGFL